jgi:hypothetical protein
MFGLIYFAEGAILSYFTALNSLYLLSFNLKMSQVGLGLSGVAVDTIGYRYTFVVIALLNLLALPLLPVNFRRSAKPAAAAAAL